MDGPVVAGGGPRRGPFGGGTDPESGAGFTGFPQKVGRAGVPGDLMGLVPRGDTGT